MNSVEYIRKVLEPIIPDTRPGTAIRDMLIKPHAILMSPLLHEIQRIKLSQSMKNYHLMNDDEMDLLAGNLLLDRKKGAASTGTARFIFNQPVSVSIPVGTAVITADGLSYVSQYDVNITGSTMKYNIVGVNYYVDVPIMAIERSSKYNNSDVGSIMNTDLSHPNLVRVESATILSGGVDEETNEELYYAAKRAIGERTLLRDDGSYTILTREFPEILRMEIIGTGDPEMERDYLPSVNIHIGGLVDHYIDTASKAYGTKQIYGLPSTIEIRKPNSGEDATYLITDTPVLSIISVEVIDPITLDPTGEYLEEGPDYSVIVIDEINNYSLYQKEKITFHSSHVGKYVNIYYSFNASIEKIQDYVMDKKNRVNNANHRIYNLIPAWISIDISFSGEGTEQEVMEAIIDFILINLRQQVHWENSDLIHYLYSTKLVDYIETPMNVKIRVDSKAGHGTETNVPSDTDIPTLNIFYPKDITVTKI